MSWNNVIPAWVFGDFNIHFEDYKNNKIDLKEFVERIKNLPEVPEIVKENRRNKLNE